ncbi:MAG: CPBP family intramembrane glutamic endopeptidase, partial [Candidatus Micrarchaeaceae archaeon]
KNKSLSASIKELGLSKKSFSFGMVLIGLGIFLSIFALEILVGLLSVITKVKINTNVSVVLQGAPIWFLLFAIFVTPFCEEILFRGFLVPRIGILLSAFVFGLLHADYNSTFGIEIIAAFIFGIIAGYVFKKTKSLYPSIIAHGIVNGITLFTTFVLMMH